ncbi:RNA-guided endonuclease InsQ/TnpB family protein [Dapis sp. BLCC M229]|uniref:RNA-guided endonuclease InsQ/TnpB family protein n=1 Tax=Dapis sp. BLCC M229 TaxID=3400188 RepID=UPI003CFA07BD
MVKPNNSWYYEVSKCIPQYALRYLSEAWKQCFSLISSQPKFKKKGRDDSFTLMVQYPPPSPPGRGARGVGQIKLPRIGWVKKIEILPDNVTPKSVTISRKAGCWFISFKIETEPSNTDKSVDVVGVDLGVKSVATLSTGEVFEGAKSYRKFEAKLSRLQYLNRHKTKFSNNWKKAQLKIAKLHSKIANIRKDTLHKLTTYLALNHNPPQSPPGRGARGVGADMGFYQFRRKLEYKCKLYGCELIIVDKWFPGSKTCSSCGNVKQYMSLSELVFQCEYCNFIWV